MTSSLKLTTAVFFLTVALKIGSIDSSSPDYIEILVPSTRTLYKYHEDVATWSDARDTCISDGGLLFYPEDQNELDTVIARLGFSNHYLHIGFRMHSNIKINHLIRIHQYQTVDGRNLSEVYRKWYRGKPVFALNKGAECGVLVVPSLEIVLGSCDLLKSYICKIALNTTEEDVGTPIDSSPPDYIEILVPSTRTLYKYHEDVATWSDARDTCISDGGLLFYPEDQNELDTVIARLGFSNHYLHIGFRMHSKIKINHLISIPQYQTVDGRNLSEVYRKWYRGKPVFALNKGAECGVVVVPSLDILLGSCDLLKSYICKIALNTTEEDVGTPIEKVCLSSSYIITASEMIGALDETKDPCNDFYDFACGGWIRNNPIAEGKSRRGIWEKMEEQNQIIIRYALGNLTRQLTEKIANLEMQLAKPKN